MQGVCLNFFLQTFNAGNTLSMWAFDQQLVISGISVLFLLRSCSLLGNF